MGARAFSFLHVVFPTFRREDYSRIHVSTGIADVWYGLAKSRVV